ncbi:MAG: hypothetical protein ABIF19_07605 [Planctomycetota bacterium]
MQHNTNEFIEEVKELAERYGFGVSIERDGESVGTSWKLRIGDAGVEVEITGRACIVTDEMGDSEQFAKSQGDWKQASLGHIETLLKSASCAEKQ